VTFGEPSSAGVPKDIAALTTVLPLDDEAAFQSFMQQHGSEVAVVIVEPIPANNGLLLQRRAFLETLRNVTRQHGALLVFDEVISGFRVATGGAAELYDLQPDLATFGKILGGGMPVGAFAGATEHFQKLAPNGPVYQAGTLSGNPVAMAAGARTLEILERDAVLPRLETLGERLEAGVQDMLKRRSWPAAFVRQGSIFWLHFGTGEAPRSAETVNPGATDDYRKFFSSCLEQGLYLAPSAYEVGFLSAAHTEADIDRACEVFEQALARTF
jgi:glutamate-1-semialdehyde 2,1-aminomutase